MTLFRVTLLALGAAAAAGRVGGSQAQRGAATPAVAAPASVAVFVGGARRAMIKTRLGHFHDRDLFVASVRASWPIGGADGVLRYTADLVPLAVATGNRFYAEPPDTGVVIPERRTAYAAGLAPLGAELRLRVARRVEVSAAASGGFLVFSIPVPDQGETRFNWTFDLGAGAHVAVSPRLRVAVGYRLSHISNGGRGPVNPGMDTRLLVLGVERAR